jgi:hypothetical protein
LYRCGWSDGFVQRAVPLHHHPAPLPSNGFHNHPAPLPSNGSHNQQLPQCIHS